MFDPTLQKPSLICEIMEGRKKLPTVFNTRLLPETVENLKQTTIIMQIATACSVPLIPILTCSSFQSAFAWNARSCAYVLLAKAYSTKHFLNLHLFLVHFKSRPLFFLYVYVTSPPTCKVLEEGEGGN